MYGPVIPLNFQKEILTEMTGEWSQTTVVAAGPRPGQEPAADVSWFYICGVLGTTNDFRRQQGLVILFFTGSCLQGSYFKRGK